MDDKKQMYCGSAKKIGNDGFLINLDLTLLFEYLKGEASNKVTQWIDKTGKVHKQIQIAAFPYREPQKYSTHSVKINDYNKD